jgi:hypothetical protein
MAQCHTHNSQSLHQQVALVSQIVVHNETHPVFTQQITGATYPTISFTLCTQPSPPPLPPPPPPLPATCDQINSPLYYVQLVFTGLGTPCDPDNSYLAMMELEVIGAGAAGARHAADGLPTRMHTYVLCVCMHVGCVRRMVAELTGDSYMWMWMWVMVPWLIPEASTTLTSACSCAYVRT